MLIKYFNMKKIIILIIVFLFIIFLNYNITELNKIPNSSWSMDATSNFENPSSPTFSSQEIPDYIYEKMLGNSIPFKHKSKVNINSLSFLQISYYGFDGKSHVGEMIVNLKLADEVLEIFKEAYEIKYPIEKISLIDEYNANDELSMSNNNTSCFCYRTIARNICNFQPSELGVQLI